MENNEQFNSSNNPFDNSNEPNFYDPPTTYGKSASSKSFSIIALVCGLAGLIGGFIPLLGEYLALLSTPLSILGIIFGALAKKRAVQNGEPTGMATAGLVLGIIGTALNVLGFLCVMCAVGLLAGIVSAA